MQPTEYQGEKFKSFVTDLKKNYANHGFSERPDNKTIAKMLGVSEVQLYKYFRTNNLTRETVTKIVELFNVTEESIWGIKDNSVFNKVEVPNMTLIPRSAFGEYLVRHRDPEYISALRKVNFPWLKDEGFGFEIEGAANIEEFMPGDWVMTTEIYDPALLVKGRFYMFQTERELRFKQFVDLSGGLIYLNALNDAYNPIAPILVRDVIRIYEKKWTVKD